MGLTPNLTPQNIAKSLTPSSSTNSSNNNSISDALYFDTNTGKIMNVNMQTGAISDVNMARDGLEQTKATSTTPSTIVSSGTNIAALDKLAAPTLANMGQLDAILANKNTQSQSEYQKNVDAYNAQNAIDKAAYDQNVHDNEYNYTKNNQAALLNAANASTGLRGFLSKIGALAGSGMDVIKRLVGMSSGADLGTSRDTFDTNAGTLNTNWSKAEQEQRQRLADAESVLQNAKLTNENNMLTSKQAMLASLANLYGADTTQGQNYASQAASLAAPLSNTSKAVVAPYVSASSLYTPEALKAYLAGTATPTLSTDNTPTANSSLYYVDTKKKDNLTNAL